MPRTTGTQGASAAKSGRATRDYVVNIRMTHEEHSMLLSLMDETGLSGSDILRNGLRREYAREIPTKRRGR